MLSHTHTHSTYYGRHCISSSLPYPASFHPDWFSCKQPWPGPSRSSSVSLSGLSAPDDYGQHTTVRQRSLQSSSILTPEYSEADPHCWICWNIWHPDGWGCIPRRLPAPPRPPIDDMSLEFWKQQIFIFVSVSFILVNHSSSVFMNCLKSSYFPRPISAFSILSSCSWISSFTFSRKTGNMTFFFKIELTLTSIGCECYGWPSQSCPFPYRWQHTLFDDVRLYLWNHCTNVLNAAMDISNANHFFVSDSNTLL